MDNFCEIIDAIELFENHDPMNKWKRCLVCGICRIPNGIAVNIGRLKKLTFKCKSSINGSLKNLGYGATVSRGSSCPQLLAMIPLLRNDPIEARQWTVRMMPSEQLFDSGAVASSVLAEEQPKWQFPIVIKKTDPLFEDPWSAM
jgi:hypothetical protein